MKSQLKVLIRKPFIRNVISLSSGTVVAQIINMLFSVLLTRLYGPVSYGIMGSFQAIISIIIPVAALSYPLSIVLPKDNRTALGLSNISLLITGINALVATILLFIFNDKIVHILNIEGVSTYIYLVPLVLVFSGIFQTLEKWLMRQQEFNILAKSVVTESLFTNSSKFLIGLIYPSASVLTFFTALKNGIKTFVIIIYTKMFTFKSSNLLSFSLKELIRLASKYKDFPLYRAPNQFLNSITSNLPLLLLTSLFGPASAGYFSIGRTVLGVPSTLIGKSVGDVFYPRISKAVNNKERIAPMLKKSTMYLAIIGIIPYGIIILFGPQLFSIIFGKEWVTGGKYAQLLSIWIFMDFLRLPSVNTLPVLKKQNLLLLFTTLLLLIQTVSFFIGYYVFNSDVTAILLFSLSGAILNMLLIVITYFQSKKYDKLHL